MIFPLPSATNKLFENSLLYFEKQFGHYAGLTHVLVILTIIIIALLICYTHNAGAKKNALPVGSDISSGEKTS